MTHEGLAVKALTAIVVSMACMPATHAAIEDATLTGGRVRGVVEEGVAAFKGLPFAAPPVGALRWKVPQPVVPWRGTRAATQFAPACMQHWDSPQNHPSEDCLYLNVWTAAASRDERRPVMVWIHGGGFAGGMSWETVSHGAPLARDGVVLVTIAYRLGAFGFLTHPELARESGSGAGNYALFDMIAALKWVQQNIAQFGGDPSRVTIFGGSSGGVAVSLLAGSPLAKGLYARAIAQGGTAPFHATDDSFREADQEVEAAGLEAFRKLQAKDLSAARAVPAAALLEATSRWPPDFGPVIDGRLVVAGNATQFESGRFNDTPILIGGTSDEAGEQPAEAVQWARDELAKVSCKEVAARVRALYSLDDETRAPLGARRLFRDFGSQSTWRWAQLQSTRGRNTAYVYYFDIHDASHPHGAPHASEYPFVFGNFPYAASADQRAASAMLRKYWVNFAATGNPNGAGLPEWKPFEQQSLTTLVIGATMRSEPSPNLDGMRALEALIACPRETPQR